MKRKQSIESVRWDLALRYRLIETVAWWEGRLTTNHLIQSFGISRQQASKDINSYISDYAPKNLEYDKHLKGYVPSRHFKPLSSTTAPAPIYTCSTKTMTAPLMSKAWHWPTRTPKCCRCRIARYARNYCAHFCAPAAKGCAWSVSTCPLLRRMQRRA